MDVKVDQTVPVPPVRHTGCTAILRTLKIGESVLLPSSNAAALAFRLFGKGAYRSHKERGGIRIWRVEVQK